MCDWRSDVCSSDLSSHPAFNPGVQSLSKFERQLTDRERQFRVLEDLLVASRLQKEVRPTGWPVENGWISSLFGVRTDPFTGRLTRHEGMDFAAPAGTDVDAVARSEEHTSELQSLMRNS